MQWKATLKSASGANRKPISIALGTVFALIAWLAVSMRDPALVPESPVKSGVPPGFIWGVSSSAYQSEGGDVDSNWKRWNDSHPDQDRCGASVDFRHRYREDVALAKSLGINTYRIGISWARLEPRKGQIDQTELAYYDDLILALKQAGITPLITLDHFVHPGWVSDQGGWANPEVVPEFVSYATLVAKRYHDDVHLWITFNEEATYMPGEIKQYKLDARGMFRMRDNLVNAHRQTYDVIHSLDPKAMVTSNILWMGDHFPGALIRKAFDWLFLDRIVDKCDVIALDYYAANILAALKADKQWDVPPEPAGLYRALRILARKYPGKPLLVAETGMPTGDAKPRDDGITREQVLRESVYWTQRARDDGINVIGYMVWSLTDNFEWGSYTPRFGLYTVNVKTDPTLTRIPTEAVEAYREVIRDAGVGAGFRPTLSQR